MSPHLPYSNNRVMWHEDVDALGKADKGHVVNQLDKALIEAKADPRTNEHIGTPGTIEQVVADAIETGDVDNVLDSMTGLVGQRLGTAAGFYEKKGAVLKAIAAWKTEHAAELRELKNNSPKFQESLMLIKAGLEALNRRTFETVAEAKLAILPITMGIENHNMRFVKKGEAGQLSRTEVATATPTFQEKPFTLKLCRAGNGNNQTKALVLDFETTTGVGPDTNTLWSMVHEDEDEGKEK